MATAVCPAISAAFHGRLQQLSRRTGFTRRCVRCACALRCYAAALEVDPKLVHVHSNMGDLWRTQGPAGSAAAAHCYSSALALQVLPLVVLHALVLERVLGVCVTWVVMFKELCLLRLPRLFGCHPKL
eukprot:scaffold16719_cov26-Tisochrysis_lutea.AAC.1